MLKDNLKNVEERVQEACDRAGRKREEEIGRASCRERV